VLLLLPELLLAPPELAFPLELLAAPVVPWPLELVPLPVVPALLELPLLEAPALLELAEPVDVLEPLVLVTMPEVLQPARMPAMTQR
jgi:hypothetical protein